MRDRAGLRRWPAALIGLLLLAGLLTACTVAGSASGSTSGSAPAAGSPPRIAVDHQVQDYGKVRFEQWVRPSFQLRNEGGSNLTIQRTSIKTIEGC